MPQEVQGSIPRQAGSRLVVRLRAVRLTEPMSSAAVTVKGHRAARAPQGFLQLVNVGLRLILIIFGEVTEVGGF